MDADFVYKNVDRFMALHSGLSVAFGTGEGRWIHRAPTKADYVKHLMGEGAGIGIAPLRPDNNVMFAAIDLDEPDFEAAFEMQGYVPGVTFVERSRSGNAHVWAFFKEPCPAWVAIGLLKEATLAAGKQHVEVFPKNHDFARVKFGNYINLSYHGDDRPILDTQRLDDHGKPLPLATFLRRANDALQDPAEWVKKAEWLMIPSPSDRVSSTEFGEQAHLHMCAEYIIENADSNPITEGHRAAVFFALARQLTNWRDCDHEEALMMMRSVNEASPDKVPDSELVRILGNAERGQFTSTGCDDALVLPYAHPSCPIAFPRNK